MSEPELSRGEKEVLVAAKFIEARWTLQQLLGDRYDAQAKGWRSLLRAVMKSNKCGPVEAAIKALKTETVAASGMQMMWVLAATADVSDETPAAESATRSTP